MRRKYLLILLLALFASTLAFSNERARFRCRTAGTTSCVTASSHKAAAEAACSSGSNLFLHTFIKLLYI
jgi:hypothetical protein